jgi:flagellar biosynthesis protein FlhF
MQLKTFTAETTLEAMNLVRNELGEDAIIVSTQQAQDGEGAHIVASLGAFPGPGQGTGKNKPSSPGIRRPAADDGPGLTQVSGLDVDEALFQALSHHGTPGPLTERLVHAAALIADDPLAGLAAALDAEFTFTAIPSSRDAKPVMLIGPPGAGKTVTTVKLAARASLAGYSVGVVSTDTQRAGANEQLTAFTRLMKVDLKIARTPDALADALSGFGRKGLDAVYIDTHAVNPFLNGDLAGLGEWTAASGADPLLVMAAGGDTSEASDIASAFADAGARRMIATRLDVTRHYGGLLAAAHKSRLGFSGVSITPRIANGLRPINAVSLARLIMPRGAIKRSRKTAPTGAADHTPEPLPRAAS